MKNEVIDVHHRGLRACAMLALSLLVGACGDDAAGPEDAGATEGSGSTSAADGTTAASESGESSGLDGSSSAGDTEQPAELDPIEATLADVRAQVAEGPVSCRTLVESYQALHEARDPEIVAIITWNEGALDRADALDAVPVGERGPLHCAPVVVKDNIDVAGLPTTGGVAALAGSVPADDATIVARLVDRGAVILGKTNMPDFALDGVDTNSSAGGHTVSPYDRTSTVYGSSGGTGAAIGASLGILGLGSDTYGSLVQPGSASGVVAIRSTQGRVPSDGILPLMTLQDVPGPMTRTVADAAALLDAMVDGGGYVDALDPDGLQGLVIGFDPAALQEIPLLGLVPDPEVGVLFDASLAAIGSAGATTQEVAALLTLLPSLQPAIDGSFACMPVDFKQGFEAYLAALPPGAPVGSLADVIASGAYLPSVEGFITDAESRTDSIEDSMECQGYLTAKQAAQDAITQMMDDQGLDLVVYPAANQAPFPAGEDPPMGWFGFQALSSPTGLPSLTLPMGLTASGKPVGLVLLARADREDLLIRAAFALEQAQAPRVPPTWP